MNQTELQAATDAIWDAQRQGIHYPPDWKGKFDVDAGYRVQLGILGRHVKAGERHAGWKVGLTAKAIQEQVGFHEPVFGFLLHSGALRSGASLTFDELIQPSFENELCVTLGRPLKGPDVTAEQAREAISGVAPGLEIVEKRGEFAADPPLSLADNVQQRYFVTGEVVPLEPGVRLSGTTVQVFINGELVDEARGDAVLGDPVASVAWLANRLAAFGHKLEAGTQVMTGSFTKQHPIAQGDLIEAHFAPFGDVSVEFV